MVHNVVTRRGAAARRGGIRHLLSAESVLVATTRTDTADRTRPMLVASGFLLCILGTLCPIASSWTSGMALSKHVRRNIVSGVPSCGRKRSLRASSQQCNSSGDLTDEVTVDQAQQGVADLSTGRTENSQLPIRAPDLAVGKRGGKATLTASTQWRMYLSLKVRDNCCSMSCRLSSINLCGEPFRSLAGHSCALVCRTCTHCR